MKTSVILSDFISQAEDLKNENYDSPQVKIFKKKVKEFVNEKWGEDYLNILNSCFRWGKVPLMGEVPSLHSRAMEKTIIFLKSIESEPEVLPQENKAQKVSALDNIHLEIKNKCGSLYEKGEYAEAVEKSFKVVKDKLRKLTGFEKGSDAFGKGNLYINGSSAPNVDEDFQNAVKFLTMAIDNFRNEKSHTSDAKIDDPTRAYEYLSLSSLAMNLLDDSKIRKSK